MARAKQVKRSRFETMYTILKICTNGLKKTHVMYRANLSHQQLEKFLAILIERNLLTIESGNYVTSERGLVYIKNFDELKRTMNGVTGPLRPNQC